MNASGPETVADALRAAEPRPDGTARATDKKNYAERLSRALSMLFANKLRLSFPGILPDERGGGQESRARTGKGFKKLDVNYSTLELGLGLGVSIKTLNFPDGKTRRFTKNYTRIDNELRAEAMDYHVRQPFAVLAGILFLPIESCDDAVGEGRGDGATSSFGSAVRHFRARSGRHDPGDLPDLFERFFIGLYDLSKEGVTVFVDVAARPPRARRPAAHETMELDRVVDEIVRTYDERNDPRFDWTD
jgi:hypothetical protein